MKIKIVSNFHVFAPGGEREKKVAFTAGTVLGPTDMPDGQTAEGWVEKGLAEEFGGVGVFDSATEG